MIGGRYTKIRLTVEHNMPGEIKITICYVEAKGGVSPEPIDLCQKDIYLWYARQRIKLNPGKKLLVNQEDYNLRRAINKAILIYNRYN